MNDIIACWLTSLQESPSHLFSETRATLTGQHLEMSPFFEDFKTIEALRYLNNRQRQSLDISEETWEGLVALLNHFTARTTQPSKDVAPLIRLITPSR